MSLVYFHKQENKMKKFFWLLVVLVQLTGCGTSSDSSSDSSIACSGSLLLGGWKHPSREETLSFDRACGFASDFCGSSGRVPNVTAASGTNTLVVTSDSGVSGCLSKGTYSCDYTINQSTIPERLSFSGNGSGTIVYVKQ